MYAAVAGLLDARVAPFPLTHEPPPSPFTISVPHLETGEREEL